MGCVTGGGAAALVNPHGGSDEIGGVYAAALLARRIRGADELSRELAR